MNIYVIIAWSKPKYSYLTHVVINCKQEPFFLIFAPKFEKTMPLNLFEYEKRKRRWVAIIGFIVCLILLNIILYFITKV
ncbi:MAG: hypothetical protein A2499_03905 [Stygiobacter sp. RIFOXYC12_FULL_38_8]|nr:MAG: hypothetical protein A2X62_15070 [Stygiobacter sp. GWC2_38_9]OGU84928.1 MAG: hypothetical protein A2279_08520 [Stygiobacter sp. RIFOXYA12_FULL_38_9]OGV06864.1 MAG: hypothetical protein A2299_03065 [Stygiobacter sp. RIFOXYB2_FULL_37_11]OGV13323.1 MAG: hypothetical protein A2440_13445 [Stygiobacter sp. RIFOXYC2_FULL_38_25]OGV15439.1 MAG: hypothetical protein A2237_07480 [Stygiobacter sp. RIFOXYA2_FULL_38_8]OGV30276.1 MAG: hypothetical protein A2499_03905 [Stygiobacter sp. RIFOXYC12_FULL_